MRWGSAQGLGNSLHILFFVYHDPVTPRAPDDFLLYHEKTAYDMMD